MPGGISYTVESYGYVWDGTAWVKATPAAGGGGGGDASAANQVAGNAALVSIDTKLTAPVAVADTRPSTSSVTNVSAQATSVTVAAANAARRGLLVFNDADKNLYLKLGATASVTSYSVRIAAGGYYEVPNPSYSGIVDGIWEAAPTGAARVTELS